MPDKLPEPSLSSQAVQPPKRTETSEATIALASSLALTPLMWDADGAGSWDDAADGARLWDTVGAGAGGRTTVRAGAGLGSGVGLRDVTGEALEPCRLASLPFAAAVVPAELAALVVSATAGSPDG